MSDLRRWALPAPGVAVVLLAVVYLGKSLLALAATYVSYSLGLRMADDWSLRLLRAYFTAPLPRLTQAQGSMINSLLSKPSQVGGGVATGGLLAQNALSTAGVYVVLLLLSPVLTAGLTLAAMVALVGVLALSRYAQRTYRRWLTAADEAYSSIAETVSAIKQLRLFGLEREAEFNALSRLRALRRQQRNSNVVASSPRLLIEVAFLLTVALLLALGLSGAPSGTSIADMGVVIVAAFRLLPGLSASAGAWVQLHQAWPGLQEIAAELDALEVKHTAPSGRLSAAFDRRVVVEGVHFAYPGRPSALDGIDIEIERGQFIGIVGPSGSGKSTLVDLLCAFYRPDRGRILVDGVDLRDIDHRAWRKKLGVVAQDSFLFSGTIRENLVVLDRSADLARMERVTSLVGADQMIRQLPQGYDTLLGERGLRLSGGQRQRLALARVLLKAPEILILDEATSALDIESDELIRENLERTRGEMTLVVVAHRLTSVRDADRIYVLTGGTVAEQGTHDELIRRAGAYATMWRAFALEDATRGAIAT